MSEPDVLYSIDNYVATLTFNRPKSLNAFTGDSIKLMQELFDRAANDRNVGVIVLTGTGERAFCVGGDVNWEKSDASGKSGLEDLEFNFNRQIVECLKPVITRVNGYAIGAGHHIAYFFRHHHRRRPLDLRPERPAGRLAGRRLYRESRRQRARPQARP